MTKKRNCFVTQVGDAIEALASALDPEREPPFRGDILDLLEWAVKDVLEMRQQLEKFNDNREAAYRLQEEKCDQLRQQLTEKDSEVAELKHKLGQRVSSYNTLEQLRATEFRLGKASRDAEVAELRQQLADSQQALRNVYEVWAGSDGMPQPTDELGWYLFQLIEKMRDAAKEGLK